MEEFKFNLNQDKMTLKNIIESRRSIFPKDYTGKVIPTEILDEVLSSATFAPSHKRTKPWRFKALLGEEKEKLGEELQRLYKENTAPAAFLQKKYEDIGFKISSASAVVPIVVEFSGLVPEWEETAAVAMAVQNMYLTCTEHHLGCYWSSPPISLMLSSYLNLTENQRCLGVFYIGTLD